MKNLVLAGLVALSMVACVTTPKPPRTCEIVVQEHANEAAAAGMVPAVVTGTPEGDYIALMLNTATGDRDAMLIKFSAHEPPPADSPFRFQEDCTFQGATGKVYRAKIGANRVGLK